MPLLCSLSLSAPQSCSDEASGIKPVDLLDHQVRNSGSDSPASGAVPERQLPEKNETSSPQTLDNYADIGLVRDTSPSYAPSDSQQQEQPELEGFSVSTLFILVPPFIYKFIVTFQILLANQFS